MTPEQFAIVNAIREAFNQLRFRFVAAEGFSVRVPWQEDPLEGRGGWTQAIKIALCRVGHSPQFGFGVGCSGVPMADYGEWLWDITWREEDDQGRMVDTPLVAECEFAFDSFDGKILEDFQKLLPARSGVRLMVHEHWSERGTSEPIDPLAMANYLSGHVQAYQHTQPDDVYLLAVLEGSVPGEEYEYHRIQYFRLNTDGTAVEMGT